MAFRRLLSLYTWYIAILVLHPIFKLSRIFPVICYKPLLVIFILPPSNFIKNISYSFRFQILWTRSYVRRETATNCYLWSAGCRFNLSRWKETNKSPSFHVVRIGTRYYPERMEALHCPCWVHSDSMDNGLQQPRPTTTEGVKISITGWC